MQILKIILKNKKYIILIYFKTKIILKNNHRQHGVVQILPMSMGNHQYKQVGHDMKKLEAYHTKPSREKIMELFKIDSLYNMKLSLKYIL